MISILGGMVKIPHVNYNGRFHGFFSLKSDSQNVQKPKYLFEDFQKKEFQIYFFENLQINILVFDVFRESLFDEKTYGILPL